MTPRGRAGVCRDRMHEDVPARGRTSQYPTGGGCAMSDVPGAAGARPFAPAMTNGGRVVKCPYCGAEYVLEDG